MALRGAPSWRSTLMLPFGGFIVGLRVWVLVDLVVCRRKKWHWLASGVLNGFSHVGKFQRDGPRVRRHDKQPSFPSKIPFIRIEIAQCG